MEKPKEPVRIRFKNLANGNKSVYLDYYIDGIRQYQFLKLYLVPERNRFDKEQNEKIMEAVEYVKAQLVIDIANGKA